MRDHDGRCLSNDDDPDIVSVRSKSLPARELALNAQYLGCFGSKVANRAYGVTGDGKYVTTPEEAKMGVAEVSSISKWGLLTASKETERKQGKPSMTW